MEMRPIGYLKCDGPLKFHHLEPVRGRPGEFSAGFIAVENPATTSATLPLQAAPERLVPRYPVETTLGEPPHRLIGLCGLAGCGKSTAAAYLEQVYGYARVRFADPLKDMMRALGLSEREIEGDLKEVPCEKLGGKTPRYGMQTVGTEWGRELIADDLWIRAWASRLPVGPVVAEDCRFQNEAEAIKERGGILIRLVGRGGIAGGHASESNRIDVDVEIENTGTIDELKTRIAFYASHTGGTLQ
jgi:hypothetical protein